MRRERGADRGGIVARLCHCFSLAAAGQVDCEQAKCAVVVLEADVDAVAVFAVSGEVDDVIVAGDLKSSFDGEADALLADSSTEFEFVDAGIEDAFECLQAGDFLDGDDVGVERLGVV